MLDKEAAYNVLYFKVLEYHAGIDEGTQLENLPCITPPVFESGLNVAVC